MGCLVNKVLKAAIAALSSLTVLNAANAASLSLTFNFAPQDFYFLPHADGSVEVDAYPLYAPITVSPGDQLTVDIHFDGARAVLHDIAPLNLGLEEVTLSLLPFDPSYFVGANVTVDLLDVQGDLVTGPEIFAGSIGFGGGLSWQVAKNLTDSVVSFSGARYQFDFKDGSGPLTLSGALFGFYGGAIAFETVPEPSTVALSLMGLMGIPMMRRRRRRQAS